MHLKRPDTSKRENGKCFDQCTACVKLANHDTLQREARSAYENDGREPLSDTIVRSIDLEKVIMLP